MYVCGVLRMSSYRCEYCGCIRYDRGQKYVQAFCIGRKECRAEQEQLERCKQ